MKKVKRNRRRESKENPYLKGPHVWVNTLGLYRMLTFINFIIEEHNFCSTSSVMKYVSRILSNALLYFRYMAVGTACQLFTNDI